MGDELDLIRDGFREIKKPENEPFVMKLGEYCAGELYSTTDTLLRIKKDADYNGRERRRKILYREDRR